MRTHEHVKAGTEKNNIKPYCLIAAALFVCLLGLQYIFAWVPHLDSGDKNALLLFSSYAGISSISGAVALMAFATLAASMGFRYITNEYCGSNAILLFSYPINRRAVLRAKTEILLCFISAAMFLTAFGGFLLFAASNLVLGMVDTPLRLTDMILALRNTLALICLADGIALIAIRIGFTKKSNSTTIVVAVVLSMLAVNLAAGINDYFPMVVLLSVSALLIGLFLTWRLSHKIDDMEV